MTRRKGLVLDANILLRTIFGQRVRAFLEAFEDAKLDALIGRDCVMMVELTSSCTTAESRIAIARLKGAEAESPNRRRLRLIVVVTSSEQVPPSAHDFPVIARPNKVTDDPEGFVTDLGDLLRCPARTGCSGT
jgi:hypothetical protein